MMRLDSLTLIEKNEIKKRAMKSGYLVVILIIVLAVFVYTSTKSISLLSLNGKYNDMGDEIASLTNSIESSKRVVDSYKISLDKSTLTKEEYVDYIGSAASSSGCNITLLNSGEIKSENNMTKLNSKVEISGELINIYKFMNKLDALDSRYALNSLSLRRTGDFLWLNRELFTSSALDWWDITNISKETKSKAETEPLSVAKIYDGNVMMFYIDIDFLSPNV